MGSLPNLHELSLVYADADWRNDVVFGRATIATKAVAAAAAAAAAAEKLGETTSGDDEGRARKSHKTVAQTRSLGADPNSCVVDGQSARKFVRGKRSLSNETRRSRSVRSSSVIPFHTNSASGCGSGGSIYGGGVGGGGGGMVFCSSSAPSHGQTFRHAPSRQASVTSSTGTSSVRKLIAVVRSTPSHLGPVYSRPLICQNFVALCLSRSLLTVAFVPIIVLEGSISAWSSSSPSSSVAGTAAGSYASVWSSSSFSPSSFFSQTPDVSARSSLSSPPYHRQHPVVSSNVGSLLIATLYFVAALSAPFSAFVNRKLGATKSLWLGHTVGVLFVGSHLYPRLYVLAPAYALMGLSISQLDHSETSYMITLASKLKLVLSDEEEYELQSKLDSTKRETLIQKLYRGMSFAQNFGLVVGGLLTWALIRLTAVATDDAQKEASVGSRPVRTRHAFAGSGYSGVADGSGGSIVGGNEIIAAVAAATLFPKEMDSRVCGYESCPQDASLLLDEYANRTWLDGLKGGGVGLVGLVGPVLPCKTTTLLAGVFLGCGAVGALVNALFVHRLRIGFNRGTSAEKSKFENVFRTLVDTIKDSKLKLVTPLLIFIGIEQGFMFADFTKLYVICAMGVENAPLIFISLGVLQFVAGVTFSLLVHHVRKYLIIGVGVVFQACLLLVLIVWKPTSDDAALFYVISAAWGVCNAIWDTLTFCLLVSSFPDRCEFPFAHNFFFRYLGLCAAFAYHGFVCTSVKLYAMCAMLAAAVLPYAWLEIKLDSMRSARPALVSGWRDR